MTKRQRNILAAVAIVAARELPDRSVETIERLTDAIKALMALEVKDE